MIGKPHPLLQVLTVNQVTAMMVPGDAGLGGSV
jgi:hypothetical protein